MAKQNSKATTGKDPEVVIENAISKTELFFQKNSKVFSYVLLAIIIIVGGWFAYKYLYVQPRNAKAQDMIYVAEQQFAIDEFEQALNGDGNNAGFLDVIQKYGNTPVGNIAKNYAGECYLRMGDYDNALVYLAKYKSVSGVTARTINAVNIGMQGDALSQKGQYKEATEKYMKAADLVPNPLTTPYYLKKAGLNYQKLNDDAKAVAAFERIRNEYPSSMEARDIEKHIGYAEQL